MSRKKPPSRRAGYTQKFYIGGHLFYLRTGEHADGTLAEIFIDASKAGTLLRALMEAFAIAVSLGLQHEVPLQEYIDAFEGFDFAPNGPVECDPRITEAVSLLDYIFRELELSYHQPKDENGR